MESCWGEECWENILCVAVYISSGTSVVRLMSCTELSSLSSMKWRFPIVKLQVMEQYSIMIRNFSGFCSFKTCNDQLILTTSGHTMVIFILEANKSVFSLLSHSSQPVNHWVISVWTSWRIERSDDCAWPLAVGLMMREGKLSKQDVQTRINSTPSGRFSTAAYSPTGGFRHGCRIHRSCGRRRIRVALFTDTSHTSWLWMERSIQRAIYTQITKEHWHFSVHSTMFSL